MTRQEYMEKLKAALEKKVPEMKDDVLEDYEAHFNIAMAEGKSEEEICDDLGDIDEFISEFASTEEKKKESNQESGHRSYTFSGRDFEGGLLDGIGRGVGEVIDNVINVVKAHTCYCSDEEEYEEEDDGIETIVSSDKSESSLKNIDIEAEIADVEFEMSDDDKVHVYYENNGSLKQQLRYRYFFREENDTIYTGVRKAYTKTGYRSINHGTSINLIVKVPKGMEKVRIRSGCGDLKIVDVNADNYKIATGSGDVEVKGIETGELSISVGSGDIDYEGKARRVKVNSASGDIKFVTDIGFTGDIHTTSGDIMFTGKGPFNLDVATVSGDIRMKLMDTDGYDFSYSVVSGDININYAGEKQTGTRKGSIRYGNGGAVIKAKTVSGDVKITD